MPGINKSLNLIIFPTEECNFRCKYCYEHFETGKMRQNVVHGIKNLISERGKDIEKLHLDWFGGEPLLAFGIVKDLMEFANRCADQNGFTLTSGMTTNLSLFSKEKQEKLIGLKVTKFQVTLDGDEEVHNLLRVTRYDTATFNIIYNNLMIFHRSALGGEIVIRLHVNTFNFESMKSLITRISEDLKGDHRISLFIRGLERLGSSNDESLPVIDDRKLSGETVKRLRDLALSHGLNLYSNSENECPACYAASFSSYAIRATGEISKCTVALYDDRNIIGHLSENGKLNIDREKLSYWVRGQFSHNKAELGCPYITAEENSLTTRRTGIE